MKKVFILFIFITTSLWSQGDLPKENLKGKISVLESKLFIISEGEKDVKHNYFSIKTFDKAGNLLTIEYFGDDNTLDTKESNIYLDGFKTETQFIKSNGSVDKVTTYVYDNNNNLKLEKKINHRGEVQNQIVYNYDGNNLLTQKKQIFPNIDYDIVDKYSYNDKKLLIENAQFSDNRTTKERYLYNNEDLLLEKEEYNHLHKKYSSVMYEYNDFDDKITLLKFDEKGEMNYFEQYEYLYDKIGNWVEKRVYIKGEWSSVEYRNILYY